MAILGHRQVAPVAHAERLDTAERASYADALIQRVCEGAWEQVPELTARLRAAGYGPGRWPGWQDLPSLPPLPKSSIPELQAKQPPFGGLVHTDYQPAVMFMSPGGILEPSMPAADTRLAELLSAAGIQSDDIVLTGFNYHFTPAGLLFHEALKQLGAVSLAGGPQHTELLIEYMVRTRATAFVGIGSHLKLLIEQAEAQGLEIGRDIPLRIAMVGAEPWAGGIRQHLRERYGIHCFDLYGTADVGFVAGECPHNSGLHLHPSVLVEVVDPASGARLPAGGVGELVLTVDNPDYPMLRYATGDLACVIDAPCQCGRTTPRIAEIVGRVGQSARVRGMLLYEHEIRQVTRGFPEIVDCRVDLSRPRDRDRLEAVLRTREPWDEARIEAFQQVFKLKCRLRLDQVRFSDDDSEFQGPLLRDVRGQAPTE